MIDLLLFTYFYVGWFAAIFLAKSDQPWISVSILILLPLGMTALLHFKNLLSLRLAILGVGVSTFGVLFDSLMASTGLISVHGQSGFFVPLWLVVIWLLFAFSMIGMRKRLRFSYKVAALLGAVSGPLSYKSGAYFEVLHMTSNVSLAVYSVFWFLTFPMFLYLIRRYS